ncbi:MAG: glycosyltransferase family 9 protein [Nitrospirota bacterium]
MNKIKTLKFLDRIIGKPLSFLALKIARCKKEIPSRYEKILIIRPGGIGDAVLLLPAINSLKGEFPYSEIDILCEKRNADIFRLSKNIKHIYLYDKDMDIFKCLKNKYDVVIDTEQWHRLSAVVAYLTRAPVRIGFDTNERKNFFSNKIPYSHEDYEVYSFFHLIKPITGKLLNFNVEEPFISTTIFPPVQSLLKGIKNAVAIFPGASVEERRWGGAKFGEVAKRLHDNGYGIVILGSGSDHTDAEKIKKCVADSLDITGRTTLSEVACILKECRLLITADSGLMHIAYGVGTPTVSLFGSGIEKKWAPAGKRNIVINKRLDCSPCTNFGYTPRCKRNVECLSYIKVEDVVKAAEILLTQKHI